MSAEKPFALREVPVLDEFTPIRIEDKDDLEAPIASDRALIQKLEIAADEEADFELIQNDEKAETMPPPNSSLGRSDTQKFLVGHRRFLS